MCDASVILFITAIILVVASLEVVAAVLPVLVVVLLVPPEERRDVTELITAACGPRRFGTRVAIRLARCAHANCVEKGRSGSWPQPCHEVGNHMVWRD